MPIVVVFFSVLLPRVVLLLLWFFSNWFTTITLNWVLVLAGFILLPYSLLWYTAVQNWYGGTWGAVQIGVMILAVLFDLGAFKSTSVRRPRE